MTDTIFESPYKTKSCCVIDNGLFVELAIVLARSFGQVYYSTTWESGFPKSNNMLTGKGIPNVERIDDFWGHINDIDLFVFPDIYHSAWQQHLVEMGKRVWGSKKGDALELQRDKAKEYVSKLGIPVGPYEVVIGFKDLRAYLKEHENQWVKINTTRGDCETFESKNYKLIEPKLDELEHQLGAKKYIMKFIVEEDLPDCVEVGYDGYCIDGMYPSKCMWGIEVKDKGYIGKVVDYENLPQCISFVNELLSPFLQKVGYRNFFSTELRVNRDKVPYFLDPCMRMGSPPGELYQEMFTNLDDIIWNGAEGKVIDPIPKGLYGAELLIHSEWADKNWQAVGFPPEMRDHIKFRNLTIINDEYYVVPQYVGLPELGAVWAVAMTMDDAIEQVKEYAEQVTGFYVDKFPECLDDAQEQIEKLKEFGIEW
jgi:hypothetical protein